MRSIAFLALIGLMAAACGAGDDASSGVVIATPGEVAALGDGTEARVTGFLFIAEDTRLCEAMLESYPPQCGGASVVIGGLDASGVVGLSSPSDPTFAAVTWTDYPLTVLGVVEDGALEVTTIAHQVFRGEADGIVSRVMPVVMPEVEGVVFAMDATNTTEDTIVAIFTNGQSAEVILSDESGAEAYRWSDGKVFDQAIRTVEISAGGTFGTLLHDALVIEDGWAIEAFFVADTLRDAVATGTLEIDG